MSVENRRQALGKADLMLGWSAVATAGAAVFAWAACCVLPIALSVAGLGLMGVAWVAGQRSWLTIAALLIPGAGWWVAWRRRRACDADASCLPPSRLTLGLLSAATLLALAMLLWRPLIEPWLLSLLREVRG